MAETEINVLGRRCLDRRLDSRGLMADAEPSVAAASNDCKNLEQRDLLPLETPSLG
jgi:hypothetical protein